MYNRWGIIDGQKKMMMGVNLYEVFISYPHMNIMYHNVSRLQRMEHKLCNNCIY